MNAHVQSIMALEAGAGAEAGIVRPIQVAENHISRRNYNDTIFVHDRAGAVGTRAHLQASAERTEWSKRVESSIRSGSSLCRSLERRGPLCVWAGAQAVFPLSSWAVSLLAGMHAVRRYVRAWRRRCVWPSPSRAHLCPPRLSTPGDRSAARPIAGARGTSDRQSGGRALSRGLTHLGLEYKYG